MLQNNQTIKFWAEDDRPREKLMLKGKHNLSDSELVAILIQTGTKDKSAIDLAREILTLSNNSLTDFSKKSIKDLCKIKGVGEAKAITLIAALELGRRKKVEEAPKKTKINSAKLAFDLFQPHFENLKHEEFYVLFLNRANVVIQLKRFSIGGISGTIVDNRLIFKEAIECLASGIILAHNHPSGQINPSNEDKKLTLKIHEIGKLLDVNLLDHIIISENSFFSFADNGLI